MNECLLDTDELKEHLLLHYQMTNCDLHPEMNEDELKEALLLEYETMRIVDPNKAKFHLSQIVKSIAPKPMEYYQENKARVSTNFGANPISQEATSHGVPESTELKEKNHKQPTRRSSISADLPTISFKVIKCNVGFRGRKQDRILQFSPNGIENIRIKGHVVSSCHPYQSVFSVTLRDTDTLVISYLEEHDYIYQSPVAIEIVHELNARIAALATRQRARFARQIVSIPHDFQANLYHQQIGNNQSGAKSASSPRQSRHNLHPQQQSKLLNLLQRGSTDLGSEPPSHHRAVSNHSSNSHHISAKSNTNNRSSVEHSLSNLGLNGNSDQSASVTRNAKIDALTGASVLERSLETIHRIFLDSKTEEGKARNSFLKNFSVLEKKPNTMVAVVRQFLDSLSQFSCEKRCGSKRIRNMLTLLYEDERYGEDEYTLETLMDMSLEIVVIGPLASRIATSIQTYTEAKDTEVLLKIEKVRDQPQSFYGIQPSEISVTNWKSAIYELNFMERKSLPSDKLKALMMTVKAIYNVHNYERNRQLLEQESQQMKSVLSEPLVASTENYFLAADEFFPIFVFVLCNSTLRRPLFNKEYIWGLCSKQSLEGSGSYYVTVLEAAIQYILGLDLEVQTPIASIHSPPSSTEQKDVSPESTPTGYNKQNILLSVVSNASGSDSSDGDGKDSCAVALSPNVVNYLNDIPGSSEADPYDVDADSTVPIPNVAINNTNQPAFVL